MNPLAIVLWSCLGSAVTLVAAVALSVWADLEEDRARRDEQEEREEWERWEERGNG